MLNLQKHIEQWGPIDARYLPVSFWTGVLGGDFPKTYNITWSELIGVVDHDRLTFFWEREALERNGIKAIQQWLLPAAARKSLADDYQRHLVALRRIAKKSGHATALSPLQFLRLAQQWYLRYSSFWDLTFVFEIANYASPSYLRRLLRHHVPAPALDHVLEVLLTPELLSFHQQAEKELLECAMCAKSAGDLHKQVRAYAVRWHWLENSYYASKALNASHFLKRVSHLDKKEAVAKLATIRSYIIEVRRKKKTVAKQYHVPSRIVRIASVLADSIWRQDHRKGVVWWASGVINTLSRALAHRRAVSVEDLMYYSAREWLLLAEHNVHLPSDVLRERKEFFVLNTKEHRSKIFTGREAQRIAQALFSLHSVKGKHASETLHGTVVSRGSGKVRGSVTVLTSPQQAGQLQKGNVLVAAMTSPDYIGAMRKAAAIVTDVGGLMSHAAVVSRELHIPCIVGTKIATQVLKDGDLVDVDTATGIVRKVEERKKSR